MLPSGHLAVKTGIVGRPIAMRRSLIGWPGKPYQEFWANQYAVSGARCLFYGLPLHVLINAVEGGQVRLLQKMRKGARALSIREV